MVTRTSRRSLLSAVGATALAGCLDRSPLGTPRQTPDPPDSVDGDWPMPAAGAGRSSYTATADGPTEPVFELWRSPVPSRASRPVVVDGTVYVGTADGTVVAFDARDGTERWRTGVGDRAGPPSVLGDTVYVPASSAVVALAAADGSQRWRTAAPSRRDTLVAPHGVYWVADATVAAIDSGDGTERWRTDVRDPWEPHLFASPDAVFLSSGVHGPVPWELAPTTGEVVGREPESGHDMPADLFYRDGVRYGLDPFFETLTAVPLDGSRGWSKGLPPQEAAAVAGGGERVYFVGAGDEKPGVYALSAADGSVDWHTGAVTTVRQRPVVARDCVLARGEDALRGFDAADGAELWALSGDAVGTRVAVAGDVVFAQDSATVAAFRPA
jgi:outer membrane protein assembly factor BamB